MSGINCAIAGATYAAAARTAKTITVLNQAQVDTAQSKFGGASALFDGTGDGLQVSAGGFNVGTGDITLEAWVRHAVINDQQVYFDTRSNQNGFIFYMRSDNKLEVYDGLSTYTSVVTMAATTLYHLALSRSGSSLKVYRDGTEVISGSNSRNLSDNSNIFVGISTDPTTYPGNSMNGHMDEIRISKTARYTAGFTPSASAFTNDADTLLLLHCDGTDATTVFTDDIGRTAKTITAFGNAQVDTAQSKFGGASYLGDGTGDGLDIATTTDFGFGTGAFTVECWVRFTSVSGSPTLWDTRTAGAGTQGLSPYLSSGQLRIYTNTTGTNIISGSTTLSTGVFYHIAVSRDNSNNLKLFLDGTQEGSTYTTSINFGSDRPMRIGQNIDNNASLNGHIDEFRVSKNTRYTTTFTPSASAFTNDSNTVLLLHADGVDASTTFTDDNA
jgi:hypothetical protein